MVKNKNNKAIWSSRIKKDASALFQKVGNSIDVDKNLFKQDILGSIVHVEMLFRQKIISFKIKNKIIYGLNKIEKEILKNKFEYKKKYEDRKQNEQSTDSSNTAGEASKDPNALANQQYDQKELLERLELMLKAKKEKEGGDLAGMTRD